MDSEILKQQANEAERLFLRNNVPFFKEDIKTYKVQGITFHLDSGEWKSSEEYGNNVYSLVRHLTQKNKAQLIRDIPWNKNVWSCPENQKLSLLMDTSGKRKIVYGRRIGHEFQSLENPSVTYEATNMVGWVLL